MFRLSLFVLFFSVSMLAKTNLEVVHNGKINDFNKRLIESLRYNKNYNIVSKLSTKKTIEFKINLKDDEINLISNLQKNKVLKLKVSGNKEEIINKIIKFIENNKARKVKFYYILNKIEKSLKNLIKNIPSITGKIISMPEAGTLGVKFDSNFNNINQGIKLRAKRQGIEKFKNAGVFYLRKRNNKIEAKYLRSEVGKFEVGDLFASKWYNPVFVMGKIIDENDSEVLKELRGKLLYKFIKISNLKFVFHKKLEYLAQSVTSFNRKKILRRLYGLGIDYFIEGFLKNEESTDLNFRIYSTYTGEMILNINL